MTGSRTASLAIAVAAAAAVIVLAWSMLGLQQFRDSERDAERPSSVAIPLDEAVPISQPELEGGELQRRTQVDRQYRSIATGLIVSMALLVTIGVLAFVIILRNRSAQTPSLAETLDELSETRDRLERAQQVGRIGSWEVSFPDEEIEWSNQALEILGVRQEELGTTLGEFIDRVHPEDRDELVRKREQWLAGGGDFEIDYRIIRPNGEVRWLHSRAHMVRRADGTPRRSIKTVQDITDSIRQRQALRQFRTLLDRSDDLCGFVDSEGRYQWVNPAYAEAYGGTPDELRGRYAEDVLGEEYFKRSVQPQLEQALAGHVQRNETTRDLASGPSRRLLARYYPVDFPGASERSVGFVLTDVTQIRAAEEHLSEQARLIGIAGTVARLGGWSVDLVRETQQWSDVVAEIHGMPHGHSPSVEEGINFYAPECRERIRKLFGDCVNAGHAYHEELQIIGADGQRRWVRVTGEPVRDEQNRIVKVQGALQDITPGMRARLEKQQLSERLSNLIETIDEGFVELDEDWRYTFVNPAAESISGKTADELIGTTIWDQFPIEGTPIDRALRQAMEERRTGSAELYFEPMGRWFDIRAYPWAPGIAVFFRDVSDHHKLVAELRRQEAALRKAGDKLGVELETRRRLINSLPAHIAMLDRDGTVLTINEQWRHYGKSGGSKDPAFGVGSNYIAVCEAATGECAAEARKVANGLRSLLAGESKHFELEYPCHSPDRQQWFRAVFNRLSDRDGGLTGVVAMHVDITERKLAELELERIAFEDALTGCLTRVGFERRLDARLTKQGWVSSAIVVILDIDGMRDVNEAHGYEIGDRLLVALSERLGKQAGPDGLIARLAGDEFAFYLPCGSSKSVDELLGRIMAHINSGFDVPGNGGSVEIEFSTGYTVLGDGPRSAEVLIQEAELAQYENRARERLHEPWVGYSPSLRQRVREYSQLTAELREALRREEFELHFQPKVDLRNGRVIAAEALIRWRHPERGLQPPGLFIPIAERSQLIGPIGNWVLRAACRYLRDWQAEGLEIVRVSINVSLVQFLIGDFTSEVERALKDFAVAPESLSLEITESVFERHSDRLVSTMNRLHEIGVQLSLDDFGTGYSSLRYLQLYRFDEVKIDQSFTAGILNDEFSRNIVGSVMSIANAMRAKTVAEGIESLEVSNALLEMGCDIGQGFYFSVPLEAEDFRWLLQTGSLLPLQSSLSENSR